MVGNYYMFKQYHFCNVFNTIYQIWLTKIYEHMYQHQNILFYHWSLTINIHEQRLFGNLEDIYFAYYMYTYADWFTEDGNINFYFYPLCHYPAETRPHLLQVQLLWIKPQPVLEFGKKNCSVVHLLFPLDLIWNIGKTLIKLRLHRL